MLFIFFAYICNEFKQTTMKKYKVKIRRLNNTLAFFYAPNETELMSMIRDKYRIDTNVFKVKVKEVI